MGLLIVAALVWLTLHIGLSGTRLRDRVVAATGEPAFRGLFSLLSLASIVFLVRTWSVTPTAWLWFVPNWVRWVLVAAMLAAFWLFVASVSRPNPTAMGAPAAAAQAPRGVFRVTRHPMLWSFALWAAVHMIGNGDAASIVFFGTFLLTALVGMPSIDAKLARRDPASWQALSALTSVVPFGAILAGRNKLVPREIGWITPSIAVLAWAALLWLHPILFGVRPVIW